MRSLLFALLCATAGPAQGVGPRIVLLPFGPIVIGTPVELRLAGLTDLVGQRIALETELLDELGRTSRSRAVFLVPGDGVVDPGRDAPEPGGSWEGIDRLGPWWSMERVQDRSIETDAIPADRSRSRITFRMSHGDRTLDAVHRVRWSRRPGVTTRALAADGVQGTLFLPPATEREERWPAIVVVGDSNGGLRGQTAFAEVLASSGFAALAVGQFGLPGLPGHLEELPLEPFDAVFAWLARQIEVDRERIAVMGGSKGGEFALLLASRRERVRSVVALCPSSVIWQSIAPGNPSTSSWSIDGAGLPFVPYADMTRFRKSRRVADIYDVALDACDDAVLERARIRVEDIRGPIMLVTGGRDDVWPAARMADDMVRRLAAVGHPFRVEHLTHPEAGHGVAGPGYGPVRPSTFMGGSPSADAHGQADSWPKIMKFLRTTLGD